MSTFQGRPIPEYFIRPDRVRLTSQMHSLLSQIGETGTVGSLIDSRQRSFLSVRTGDVLVHSRAKREFGGFEDTAAQNPLMGWKTAKGPSCSILLLRQEQQYLMLYRNHQKDSGEFLVGGHKGYLNAEKKIRRVSFCGQKVEFYLLHDTPQTIRNGLDLLPQIFFSPVWRRKILANGHSEVGRIWPRCPPPGSRRREHKFIRGSCSLALSSSS